ncbi:zinc finger CCCH domain-containing protein 15-like [Acanthochromis polyacanthus]|uniref:zinc finger CCCH domain-containing protein 15-like n=1 Tax=Acanthochromis polyacanthus TaxID=80966 RepID=UPI00223451EC|nr:zinc finger CCCH domain-containing protein 15-like [Acanthochromis polyacanthus]
MERKCEKRGVYVDERDEELEKDTMENWDEKKLEEAVNKKHGEAEKKKAKTQTVCKYFLEAIENTKFSVKTQESKYSETRFQFIAILPKC